MTPGIPSQELLSDSDDPLEVEALRREIERLQALASRDRGLLTAILRHSPHGIIVCDERGRLVLLNRAAERIWGGSSTSETVADWSRYRAFHPDGRPYQGDDWSMARALRRGEIVEAEEVQIQRFDGTRGVLLGSTAPIRNADGQIQGAISVFADITRFKEIEQALRADAEAAQRRMAFLLEASTLLTSSLDPEDTLASVARLAVPRIADWCSVHLAETFERGAVAVAHVDPAKAELARELARRYPPDALARRGVPHVLRTGHAELYAVVTDVMLAAAARDEEHLRILRELKLGSAMIVPMTARGRILGALTFVAADSGRRYGAADLEMAESLGRRAALAIDNALLYAESQQAIRARDDVLAIVAHDLRNPLHAIGMASNLLSRPGVPAERIRAHAASIERSSRRMGRLIRDLLDSSLIESGRISLDRQTFLATVLLEEAAGSIRPLATEKRIAVAVLAGDAALEVDCDHERALQILSNLLGNAVTFTPPDGRVTLAAARDGGSAKFSVADNGPGIPPEHQDRIFDRYWKSRESRQGAGLGLAIAKGLVEAHGGRIWVESRAGGGATFHFTLPQPRPALAC